MGHRATVFCMALALLAFSASGALAQLGQVDLLTALNLDLVRAEFRGNGDGSVVGQLWSRPGDGPQQLTVPPGTQFWAQLGGRQGMTTLGSNTIGFGRGGYAQVRIPTACTDFGLPAPTRRDIMGPHPAPDERIARIAAMAGEPDVHPAAVQVAVWAVANNPPGEFITKYLDGAVKAAKRGDAETEVTSDSLLQEARRLLTRAGVDVNDLMMFR